MAPAMAAGLQALRRAEARTPPAPIVQIESEEEIMDRLLAKAWSLAEAGDYSAARSEYFRLREVYGADLRKKIDRRLALLDCVEDNPTVSYSGYPELLGEAKEALRSRNFYQLRRVLVCGTFMGAPGNGFEELADGGRVLASLLGKQAPRDVSTKGESTLWVLPRKGRAFELHFDGFGKNRRVWVKREYD